MTNWIAAVSVIVALITWVVTQRQDQRAKRAAHTADFLALVLTNEPLAEARYRMAKFIEAGARIDRSSLDPTTERSIMLLLNYYEYVCTFYFRHVLDQRLVKELRGGTMKRAFALSEGLILSLRSTVDPTLFESFERFSREA